MAGIGYRLSHSSSGQHCVCKGGKARLPPSDNSMLGAKRLKTSINIWFTEELGNNIDRIQL
jgi:hypothetical protein